MGVVGEAKEYGPWRATMELTRGRGPFPTVMARTEVLSDKKEEREMAVRKRSPLEKFLDHTLNIREMPFWI